MTWPEKAELAATIQQMLKTVPVGMFALARDAVDEICLFDARGVRYTITPPIYWAISRVLHSDRMGRRAAVERKSQRRRKASAGMTG
jgi:hypothetical protein